MNAKEEDADRSHGTRALKTSLMRFRPQFPEPAARGPLPSGIGRADHDEIRPGRGSPSRGVAVRALIIFLRIRVFALGPHTRVTIRKSRPQALRMAFSLSCTEPLRPSNTRFFGRASQASPRANGAARQSHFGELFRIHAGEQCNGEQPRTIRPHGNAGANSLRRSVHHRSSAQGMNIHQLQAR